LAIKKSSCESPNKVSCFELSGKVYHENVTELENVLNKSIQEGSRVIVLDCQELKMIDSSGLSVLIQVIKHLSQRDGSLKLCNLSEAVGKVIRLSNLEKFVDIHEDVESALEEFS